MDRAQLFETLSHLPPQDFERLLFAVKPPGGLIPGDTAPQMNRVKALLDWAEGFGGRGIAAIAQPLANLNRCEFDSYLRSLVATYEKWWEHYTLTDAIGKIEPPEKPSVFDFGLMVQTVTKEQDDANRLQEKQEKTERLPVLAGIRKYADNHVLLVGRPGSGKSTALIRLLLEEANACLSNSGLLDSYQAISRENAYHPIPPAPLEKGGEAVKIPLKKGDLGGSSKASQSVESDVHPSIPSGRGEPERVPVLVELRYWEHSIEGLIQGFLQRHGLTLDGPTLSTLLGQGRFLLLVDGLNELPSEEARTQLSAFRRNHPKLPMIFTTRDLGLGGDLGIEKKLEMQPLTEAQMKAFIRAYVPDQAEAMLRQLHDRLREFGQTPLLLWMLCEVFQQSPNRQLPTNLAEVFRAFTTMYEDSSVRKHEVALLKGDVRPLSDRRLWKDALKALAALMMQGETPVDFRVAIHRTEAERELSKLFANEKFPVRDILDDLLKYHLLQNRTTDQLEFRHQLIQEYYAAEHLLNLLPDLLKDEEKFKRDYLNLLKWTEAIALMLALVDDETQSLRLVKVAMNDVDLMLGAQLAGKIKEKFQGSAISFINRLDVPHGFRLILLGSTCSKSALKLIEEAIYRDEFRNSYQIYSALEKFDNDSAVPTLIDLSNYFRKNNRDELAYTTKLLGRIGSERAIDELIEIFEFETKDSYERNSENELRKMIISGNEIATRKAINILEDRHASHFSRKSLAIILGLSGKDEAIPVLLDLLEDKSLLIRESAAEVLGEFSDEKIIAYLLKAFEKNSSPWIFRNLSDSIWKISLRSGKQKTNEIFLNFSQMLEHRRSGIRAKGAFALGWGALSPEIISLVDDKAVREAVIKLMRMLKDKSPKIREEAIYALGNLSVREAISEVSSSLLDRVPEVRAMARRALLEIDKGRAIEELSKMSTNFNYELRYEAVYALWDIEDEEAIPHFMKFLRDEDHDIRSHAASGIGELALISKNFLSSSKFDCDLLSLELMESGKYIETLPDSIIAIGQVAKSLSESTSENFRSIKERIIPWLKSMLKHSELEVRQEAALALGRLGEEESVFYLIDILASQNRGYWNILDAALSIFNIDADLGLDELFNLVGKLPESMLINSGNEEYVEDLEEELFKNFLHAIKKVDDKLVTHKLLEILNSSGFDGAKSVALILGLIGDSCSLPFLQNELMKRGEDYIKSAILKIQSRFKIYNHEIFYNVISEVKTISLYCSYALADEALQTQLANHLTLLERQGVITSWSSHQILPGSDRTQTIHQQLNTADIILLLISPDAIADDTCYHLEIQRAIERHQSGEARVIPILLRPVDWQGAPFSQLDVLPKNHQPVTTWPNPDEAFREIAEGIRTVAMEIRREKDNFGNMDAI